jgi:predicted DNA-binding protein YlxM (UPF0122 family)
MDLDSRELQLALFERYGSLLTQHQRSLLELYLGADWSLGEIAERQGTSRAAVHDLIRRSLKALEQYEVRLGLLAEERRRRRANEAMQRRVGDLRRRLERLEAELAHV